MNPAYEICRTDGSRREPDATYGEAKIWILCRDCTIGALAGRRKYGAVIQLENGDDYDPDAYFLTRDTAIDDAEERIARLNQACASRGRKGTEAPAGPVTQEHHAAT